MELDLDRNVVELEVGIGFGIFPQLKLGSHSMTPVTPNLAGIYLRPQKTFFTGYLGPCTIRATIVTSYGKVNEHNGLVATDAELMNILYDLTISDELVRVNYAYDQKSILGEAARELARFLEYKSAPVYSTVLSRVKSVLDYYDPLGPYASIWIAAVEGIYDSDACADFGICGIRTEIARRVLSMEYSCNESLAIRTQSMTPFEMDKACVKLRELEAVFHQRLNTNYEPVADDMNARLEIVVFSNDDSYETYSYFLFGNSTSNGGIYLEGEPSDPSNTARFYAYNADWLPESPVWNLEHEYIHYLDGRFIKYGSWLGTHNTLWWAEGLAEYISKADNITEQMGMSRPLLNLVG